MERSLLVLTLALDTCMLPSLPIGGDEDESGSTSSDSQGDGKTSTSGPSGSTTSTTGVATASTGAATSGGMVETTGGGEMEAGDGMGPGEGTGVGSGTPDETGGGSTEETGGDPAPVPVPENDDIECELGAPPAASANPLLPNPFSRFDGTLVTTREEWRCRRQEILALAESTLFGEKPTRPAMVTGTVSREEGITVNVSHGGRTVEFSASIQWPSGPGPYPVIIGFGRADPASHSAVVREEGVAIINFPNTLIASETLRTDKRGAFYDLYGSESDQGLFIAWAWGVSRIIDVLEEAGGDLLRYDAVGVMGCSRFGKGAVVAGAFDQRVTLTLPVEPGGGDLPIYRGLSTVDFPTPTQIYEETYWLGDAFEGYVDAIDWLPIDSHEVVGLIAPRGLMILDNGFIPELAPVASHLAALGGAEVYRALGAEGNLGYVSEARNNIHCEWQPQFDAPFRNAIRTHLTQTADLPSEIRAHPDASGNLAEWIDWSTPTLE